MAGDVGSNTTSTMVGMFKEVYGDDIKQLYPTVTKVARLLRFTEGELIGNKFHQPVDLTMEHGVTYAASGAGAFSLLDPSPGQMQDAQVQGNQILARASVDYETIHKAAKAGKAAFANATQHIVKRLSSAAVKRLEINLLHGQKGIGTLGSVSGTSTTRAWVISDASWSAGIWAGMENATLDVFAADYSGTKVNSNAKVVVTSVDLDTKTVNVSGNATDLTACIAGMQVFFETSSPTNDFAGLNAILANTGTLFNINAATYALWKGNTKAVGGAISMAHILGGLSKAVSRGLMSDTVFLCSPQAFETLNDDMAALRHFDHSYKSSDAVSGFEGITFIGQSGKCTITPHLFQKDGLSMALNPSDGKRIGSTDLTFIERGKGEEKLIRELTDKAGSEMRCYTMQAPFIEKPAHAVLYTGITA